MSRGFAQRETFEVPLMMVDLLGAFTRHPAGQIGQPFYGWFTAGDILFQAASAALVGEGR